MANNLTKKQQVFIFEYLKQGNGTRAAICVGSLPEPYFFAQGTEGTGLGKKFGL